MTITTVNHTAGFATSSDATYRAWGSQWGAAIVAAGWVQTADTGQVNWATVTMPAVGNNGVYEVYRLDDALQATDPVYLKVIYARASTTNAGILRFQAGTATDGAGTVTSAANTGTSTTAVIEAQNGSSSGGGSNAIRSYVAGDGSSLCVFIAPLDIATSFHPAGLFLLERRREEDGTPAAGGFLCMGFPGGTQSVGGAAYHTVYTNNTHAQPGVGSNGPALTGRHASSTIDSGAKNSAVPLFPVLTGGYPELGAPSKWVVGQYRNDFPTGTLFPLTIYGEAGTFMSCGPSWAASTAVTFGMGNARMVPAVRVA